MAGEIRTEESKRLFRQARKIFPGGVNSPVRAFGSIHSEPFVVSRGEGPYLFDVDGNRYVDYVLSWGPLVLGHAHPAVVNAIIDQAGKGTSFGACCELEAKLGLFIQQCMPSLEMLRFVNSGTEAAMTALRLARAFTKRKKIVKFEGCYHGHVDSLLVQAGSGMLTLGMPSSAGVYEEAVRDTLPAVFNDLESVSQLFWDFPKKIAAVIVEPVIGNAGLIEPAAGFLRGVREITDREGALLIFDEVMTGFRVHRGGAQALYGIEPDLTMLGKVIGGGLPVGAVGGRREIMEMLAPLGPVYQAGTLSGNPLAMAAGLANLIEWVERNGFERAARAAEDLLTALRQESARSGVPLSANGVGTMFGFFFHPGPVRDYRDAKHASVGQFSRFFRLMLERGVYFAPSQFEAGFISSCHEGDALLQTKAALAEVFALL